MEEIKEIGRFGFGIKLFLHPDGKLESRLQTANQGVPEEIIIMNLKEFLQRMEKDFSERFHETFGRGRQ